MKIALMLKEQENRIIWSYKYGGAFTIIVKINEKVLKEFVRGFCCHAQVCTGGTYYAPA